MTKEEDKIKEKETINEALKLCGYPWWTITSVKEKMVKKEGKKKEKLEENERSRRMIMILYVKGLSKRIARVMKKRISIAMQPHTTHRNLCVHPKDTVEPREGVYKIKCQDSPVARLNTLLS